MIPEPGLEDLADHGERPAAVMAQQVLDVLEHEGLGLVMADDPRHVEEQGALRLVCETVGAVQGVFFRDAG